MRNLISRTSWMLHIVLLIFIIHPSYSQYNFQCLKDSKNTKAPALPDAYSTDIRINFIYEQYTMEVKYAKIGKTNKELLELKTQNKHARYITTGKETPALVVEYREDAHPSCTLTDKTKILEAIHEEFAGKNNIFLKAIEAMTFPDLFDLYSVAPYAETGIFAHRFEACIPELKVNFTMAFAVKDWNQTRVSSKVNASYPVMAIAEIENTHMTALYSNFDPNMPDDAVFQPPEDVYCEGFRADRKPPQMPDSFSYNAEIIVFESVYGLAPFISYREVYYDYPAGICRIDFYDSLSEDSDLFSKVRAQRKSLIHDIHAGTNFLLDMNTGQCMKSSFQVTPSVFSIHDTQDGKMFKGDEYFYLNGTKTSYNGQYFVNGRRADVYTASVEDPETKKKEIISWAFSTEETRIVESENVGKNLLLRMYVRPENDMGYEVVVQVNFYKFSKQEPSDSEFDITSCYDETNSKTLVLTFPTYETLKGTQKMIGMLTHLAIRRITGIRKHRISVKEVIFNGKYIYAEFTLLEDSSVKGKTEDKISLDDALAKLKKAVSDGTFIVDVPDTKNQTVSLRAEPDGLNVFSGDRDRTPRREGYKEGSVISLTIGMLLLGFILGGVTLNLIMNKKFGVSLFKKSPFGHTQFDNGIESSM